VEHSDHFDLEEIFGGDVVLSDDETAVSIERQILQEEYEISMSPAAALRQLYGPAADWRDSSQKDIIIDSLKLSSIQGILAVLPTGWGKSLFFLIPAIVNTSKVTVVFLPLRALLHDVAEGVRKRGIRCMVWGEDKTPNVSVDTLLLASTDAYAASSTLRLYLKSLETTDRLGTIVIDEAHLLLTAVFRADRLQYIRNIRDRIAPIILLTATLPPSMEVELKQLLCFDPHQCTTFRKPSDRPNIRYLLHRPNDYEDAWLQLCRFAKSSIAGDLRASHPHLPTWFQQWTALLQPAEKGIIFALTKEEVEKISQEFRIPGYHSGMSATCQLQQLQEWKGTPQQWIVGTSGLGAGVNVPNVACVIHWGIPPDILDWVQMAGRGGRGIAMAYSITIAPAQITPGWKPLFESATLLHPKRLQALEDIINSDSCIRQKLEMYLDGTDDAGPCMGRSVEPCWVCNLEQPVVPPAPILPSHNSMLPALTPKPTHSEANPKVSSIRQSRQNSGKAKDFLVEVLRRWGIGCTYCHVLSEPDCPRDVTDQHTVRECGVWEKKGVVWGKLWFKNGGARGNLKFRPKTCCYRCACPNSICTQGRAGGDKDLCPFPSVLQDAVFAACHSERVRKALEQHLPKAILERSPLELWETLPTEYMWEGEYCTRMVLVFIVAAESLGLKDAYNTHGHLL
jgi:superfamily II DNA helicase RecQ